MNDFAFYFDLGWHHIISKNAWDHLLFIIALAAIYLARDWKQVLVLVTAFTIGHSLTLALSVYGLLHVNSKWIEFLIPVTIIITAAFNFSLTDYKARSLRLNYFLALFFGLIHGLGFASIIRFMLSKDQSIAIPLLGFNLGLETGQLAVVAMILLLGYLLVTKTGIQRRWWVWGLSAVAFVNAIYMSFERLPF